ncbi:MAG: hypothetical protein L0215_25455, partial [Gemmataceae bacterium]|nr:hypothetical protein [Gemmataceae bacterium]
RLSPLTPLPKGARRTSAAPFQVTWEKIAFLVLFAFVAVTGFGSMYYHAAPDNERLYWDRLPLTIVFMAFFTLIVGERISPRAGAWLFVPLLLVGAGSVTYWHWTEKLGIGDVRFYALVQFLPMSLLPLLLLMFPPRYDRTVDLFAVLGWYALAKLLEHLDQPIFTATDRVVSGHTLKHLIASLGAYWVLRMLRLRKALLANQGSRHSCPCGC